MRSGTVVFIVRDSFSVHILVALSSGVVQICVNGWCFCRWWCCYLYWHKIWKFIIVYQIFKPPVAMYMSYKFGKAVPSFSVDYVSA